jgi:glycyl-tRNA synthetase beta chain
MTGELLLEIGTEEIPSDYLEAGLADLKRLTQSYLKDHRISVAGDVCTCGTPRRLVLIGEAIASTQEDVVQEITGPPKKAAFDESGRPTKAAMGFARKQGVSLEELSILDTPRGQYVYVKRKIPGRSTPEVLSEILPSVIAEISWPKSMRWGSGSFSFVRPIHWVLALFDGNVIPFELAGIKSGNKTRGHRFLAPDNVEVLDLKDYFRKMRELSVIVDLEERKALVEKVVAEAAKTISATVTKDAELLSTVTNVVELPSAVCGAFDESFLNIPEPVLITCMKQHQKYFALRDGEGRLMPNFIAVNNTPARDESVVRKGHERVLRARLSDAAFFFEEDRKRPLLDRLQDLKEVIYQAELGTSYAKVQRFSRLAEYVCEQVAPDRIEAVRMAARLSKCDLVTDMVTEFPALQGIMGKEYARLDGHPEEVCQAVHEHYLPERAGDNLPASAVGAIVGLADRVDTIAGFFAIKLEPTGAADPFGLRRHSLAIIRILEHMGWDVSLKQCLSRSLAILSQEITIDENGVFNKIYEFFRERYRQMMLRAGYASDLIEAVISVEFDRIGLLHHRLEQLRKFAEESEEFESLVLTFKRVTNIIKKEEGSPTVDPSLFREGCEKRLWDLYQDIKDGVSLLMGERSFYEALNVLVRLREPVDTLFDQVEILTRDASELRDNRVAMMQHLARLFLRLADFSKFSI